MMNRKTFGKMIGLMLLLFHVFTVLAQKPNMLVIMADDLDSRQLSCYGGKNINHIDALAAEGMKFNNMIASEAMCVPTRASLFTGLYPMHHGSFQNHKPVYDSIKSIGHYLSAQGYTVALTGKDHSTKPVSVFPFQIVKAYETNCVAPTDDYNINGIKDFITAQKTPYCLFVMSINPHAPWTLGDRSEFDANKLILPPHWIDTRAMREEFVKYLAEVRRLDNQVGELMQLLKETGQDKNTIVVFLGEQGPQFPGGKWTLWDNGQRSSMIVRWPGQVKSNSHTDAIVQYEDITPTFLAIAGGKIIPDLDGQSFLPVLKGQTNKHRDYAYGIHNNIPEGPPYPIRSIRSQRYKLLLNLTAEKPYYIKYMMNPAKKDSYWNGWLYKSKSSAEAKALIDRIANRPAVEFYDLKKDPYELHNLAANPAYQKQVQDYTILLSAWMKQQGDSGANTDREYPISNNKE
jgi:N-sulfoglucosamine sulfohydrolase